jgi:hypothetical protein
MEEDIVELTIHDCDQDELKLRKFYRSEEQAKRVAEQDFKKRMKKAGEEVEKPLRWKGKSGKLTTGELPAIPFKYDIKEVVVEDEDEDPED